MKFLILTSAIIFLACDLNAQAAGNKRSLGTIHLPDQQIEVGHPDPNRLIVSVAGLYNAQPDAFVAIFNLKQAGETAEEVDVLMNERLQAVISGVKSLESFESSHVDMISFTPLYDRSIEKKLFSKRTYNEIPVGFEVQKNLHIHYRNAEDLDRIVSICARNEVYDLVRVDYYLKDMEAVKRELIEKGALMVDTRIKDKEAMLGKSLADIDRRTLDGFQVFYPIERYGSHTSQQATKLYYQSNSFAPDTKNPTNLYYDPVVGKEFDFTFNPIIVEPVVQVLYEIKVVFDLTEKVEQKPAEKAEKEFFWLTPNGTVTKLNS